MKKIQTIVMILSLLGLGFIVFQNIERGREIQRLRFNEENFRKDFGDFKNDLIQIQFDGKNSIEKFLSEQQEISSSALKNIKSKLEQQNVKLSRIDRLVVTQLNSVDTTYNKIVLDSIGKMITWIKQSEKERVQIPFQDKSTCFEFKANLVFEDGQTYVEVIDRKYNDTLVHVSTWERNQWKLFGLIPTRFLGKKISTVEISNNCGFSKVFVIDNKKANRKRSKQ